MRPVIALLTDFGTTDHYVGAMKGAILAVAPDAQLVDILHDVAPQDVEGGAYELASAYAAFPAGTVFVAVVDPGVGSSRRGLAVGAGVHRFVAPDNGILTGIFEDHPEARVHALAVRRFWRDTVSSTFHGRDVFGPVAGHLAMGTPLEEVGPAITDPHRLPRAAVRAVGPDEWEATAVHVDRFGNAITNVTARVLDEIRAGPGGERCDVVVRAGAVVAPLVETYSDVAIGEACALLGSSGRLEIAVNGGSAAALAGIGRGATLRVRRVRAAAI